MLPVQGGMAWGGQAAGYSHEIHRAAQCDFGRSGESYLAIRLFGDGEPTAKDVHEVGRAWRGLVDTHCGDGGCTRASATRQRLANPAFEDAHRNMVRAPARYELNIDAIRKQVFGNHSRCFGQCAGISKVVDKGDGVRIRTKHRHGAPRSRLAAHDNVAIR
jgi:hypothetical protein